MSQKTTSELGVALAHLREQFDELKGKLDDKIKLSADYASLQQVHQLSASIQDRIERQFRNSFIVAGILLTILGGVGYFGMQGFVSSAIKERFDTNLLNELNGKKAEAEEALKSIHSAASAVQANQLIVLQTDYGSSSPYMGALKGKIYSINPHARIDVTTADVQALDVLQAAWVLERSSQSYPKNTIFVSITEPGGIITSPIAVLTKNGHIYLGHDNGSLDLVVKAYGDVATYAINSPDISPTEYNVLFGGLEVFGPAAGRISLGFDLAKIGPKRSAYEPRLQELIHKITDGKADGTIMNVDRFGNTNTNISKYDMVTLNLRYDQQFAVAINDKPVTLVLKRTYADVAKGDPVAVVFDNYLQFAINFGDFATKFGIRPASRFSISKFN